MLKRAGIGLRRGNNELESSCKEAALYPRLSRRRAGFAFLRQFRIFRKIEPLGGILVWSILFLLGIFALSTDRACAEQFTPYDEIKKQSSIFERRPSFDTTPVKVTVVDVTYQIPRNYLVYLDPAIPTLKLTWPGLKPLTPETQKCFGSILQSEAAGCTSLEFHILGSRGPGPGGRALTNAERFHNFMKGFEHVRPRSGPVGTEIYDVGPENARIEIYRKDEGDVYFDCMISDYRGKRGAVCNDLFVLDDKNGVQFFFVLSLLRTFLISKPAYEGL